MRKKKNKAQETQRREILRKNDLVNPTPPAARFWPVS